MVQLSQRPLPFRVDCHHPEHRLFDRLFHPSLAQIPLLSMAHKPRPYPPSHCQLDYVLHFHRRIAGHVDSCTARGWPIWTLQSTIPSLEQRLPGFPVYIYDSDQVLLSDWICLQHDNVRARYQRDISLPRPTSLLPSGNRQRHTHDSQLHYISDN